MTLSLEPLSIEGKSFELSVDAETPNFKAKSGAYSYAVWDDRNRVVYGPGKTVLERLVGGNFTTTLITPSDLRDGFFRVHVGAALAGDEGFVDSVEANVYLEVVGDEAWIIPQEEWRIRSMHSFAMPVISSSEAETVADPLESLRNAKPANGELTRPGVINTEETAGDRARGDIHGESE